MDVWLNNYKNVLYILYVINYTCKTTEVSEVIICIESKY